MEQALASLHLEGLEPDAEALALLRAVASAELSAEEALEQTSTPYSSGA